MSEPIIDPAAQTELPLGDNDYERNLLDQLLVDSRLYKSSKEFKELLAASLRHSAQDERGRARVHTLRLGDHALQEMLD
jgi:hypothetical protein